MVSIKEKLKTAFVVLKEKFGYTNPMETPRILKVVLSSGVGSFKDKKKIDTVMDRLTKISGQKSAKRKVKESIAAFKVRKGDTVGVMVTLRGARQYGFLDKLIHVALPRMRDFRGIDPNSIDAAGNLTIGIREQTIFPETTDEELKDVFGFAVTIVTTAKTRTEAQAFFKHLGLPLRKHSVLEEVPKRKKNKKVPVPVT